MSVKRVECVMPEEMSGPCGIKTKGSHSLHEDASSMESVLPKRPIGLGDKLEGHRVLFIVPKLMTESHVSIIIKNAKYLKIQLTLKLPLRSCALHLIKDFSSLKLVMA